MKTAISLAVLLLAVSVWADERPNIVFLLTDDQSTFSVGCYGNPDVKTPNMDKLGRDGMIFDNHYVTTSICMGSRANIMTGKYEFKNGCNFQHGSLALEQWEQSYPHLLRKHGYFTAMAGKIGFKVPIDGKDSLPIDYFDRWGASDGQTSYVTAENWSIRKYAEKYPHATRAYGAFGADFIAEAATMDKPFALSISFKAPHRPHTMTDPLFDDVYKDSIFTKPLNFGEENGRHFSNQTRAGRQFAQFYDYNYPKKYDKIMAKYHRLVYGVDVAIGMVRDALEEHGVANNTVIIFTSDNGFMCGSHGLDGKVLPYEESSLVPLIMYDPRHKNSGQQKRTQSLTGNVDFAPTILDLAGVPHPPGMDGKSLLTIYDKPWLRTHAALPLMNVWGPEEVHSLSVVTRSYKYIYWPWAGEGFTASEELYKTKADDIEMKNRIVERRPRRVIDKMRRYHDDFVEQWKAEAVSFNNYTAFGTFFDRNVPWKDKLDTFKGTWKRKPK